MGLLEGKNALIFGVANKDSIAWGIAQAFHREGAKLAFSYAGSKLERRVRPLAESLEAAFVEPCDVTNDAELDAVFQKYKEQMGRLDILIHSVAYAPSEDLGGRYSDMSRAGFHLALDISAYSLVAMAKRARSLMINGGSIQAMTYYAAEKVMPNYNAMAVAKAALETSVKYLAADLGQEKIRVNAISAGAIKTLAAAGIPGFRKMLNMSGRIAPLHSLVDQDDVGNAAVFLASDWGHLITGEVMHVDAGYNILGYTDIRHDHSEHNNSDAAAE
jgi:enoyl-[acyl-carrier protein] reductase I